MIDATPTNLRSVYMEWMHTVSIIMSVIASAYFIHRDVMLDMKSQAARTDKLYEMFIDLIKEGKK
jgi:hypothetical protein